MKKYHAYTKEQDGAATDGHNNTGETQLVPSKQSSLACPKCEDTFPTEYLLKKHLKFVHQVFTCIFNFLYVILTSPSSLSTEKGFTHDQVHIKSV